MGLESKPTDITPKKSDSQQNTLKIDDPDYGKNYHQNTLRIDGLERFNKLLEGILINIGKAQELFQEEFSHIPVFDRFYRAEEIKHSIITQINQLLKKLVDSERVTSDLVDIISRARERVRSTNFKTNSGLINLCNELPEILSPRTSGVFQSGPHHHTDR
jgi:hypothetical protein